MLNPVPAGMTPDRTSHFGLTGLMNAANSASYGQIAAVTTAGTASVLTIAQVMAGVVQLNAGASGGFTVTLPATTAILGALGPVPTDGSFSKILTFVNNNVGQIGTITAGDSSTTVTGTATVATNTVRDYILNVASATTITVTNIGTKTL